VVSTTGLVSYWKLDEASGTRADSHGTNTLTDNNTVASGTGKINNAADFEFSNGLESLSHTSNTDLQTGDIDFTITAWVNLESGPNNYNGIVTKDGAAGRDYFLVYDNVVSHFIFYCRRSATDVKAEATTFGVPSLSTWYFIAAWHDATADTVNIQINNGAVNSTASGGALDSPTTIAFHIGAAAWGVGTEFDGLIDEVGFWKRVLSSQDRTDLYNAGAGLAYPFGAAAQDTPELRTGRFGMRQLLAQ